MTPPSEERVGMKVEDSSPESESASAATPVESYAPPAAVGKYRYSSIEKSRPSSMCGFELPPAVTGSASMVSSVNSWSEGRRGSQVRPSRWDEALSAQFGNVRQSRRESDNFSEKIRVSLTRKISESVAGESSRAGNSDSVIEPYLGERSEAEIQALPDDMAVEADGVKKNTGTMWAGEFGDTYAEYSAVFAKDADAEHIDMLGVPTRDVIMPAIEEALKDLKGKALSEAKMLEIGCGTGSMLDVLRVEGANPDFLYGVDLNKRCVEIANANHKFHVQQVADYNYTLPGNPDLDIVFCEQCLNLVPPAEVEGFFAKIRQLHPRYFIFHEGINPNGYQLADWGEWSAHTNDFLKLCTEKFGAPIYVENFKAKDPEMFAPVTHDTTAVFRLGKAE
ncbi:hypothetical protein FOL47_008330 [Perkinsus chesapeaki]|uniref:Methyltransferase domain-containing protein n=1 Tax=Perkinsus chesapeaki TaxID=330153 RepID=A0A7J6LEL7_PERCH|nr:hypothetical protein FOL47_008330 [Perkinsus chesapeaki]